MKYANSLLMAALAIAVGAVAMLHPIASQADTGCRVYVPGQMMTAGCWKLLPPTTSTVIQYDSNNLPTNLAMGLGSDGNSGYTAPAKISYDSSTTGVLMCNNLSYRTDVVECHVHFHIKATINGPFTRSNGHLAFYIGPPACCSGGDVVVPLSEYSGYQYPQNLPVNSGADSGNGIHYWYIVMSPGATQAIYNVHWTDVNLIPDSYGGHAVIEWRGSTPDYLVCKNQPSQSGCPLAG